MDVGFFFFFSFFTVFDIDVLLLNISSYTTYPA